MMLEGPSPTDLHAVVDEVWTTFLGPEEPLLPADPALVAGGGASAGVTWSAATTVSGAWNGVVSVEIADAVAHTATQTMLGLGPDEQISTEDVADAVGELVNMIGGNVKSLMPGPSALSLPLVARGTIASPSDLTQVARRDLSWAGSLLRVTVMARRDAVAPATTAQTRESA